ncbi:response regulator [Carboxylicivirga marina]|uniref:response regulator n=1 Tax=Carboxylicivirga marina TaxID=2800988 RepID=UPI0025916F52|nr:response regulator [uncultured Carboxylicivirga sp.]
MNSTAYNKILIVDDTPSVIDIIREILMRAGYEVAIATSGEKALKKLDVIHPDLILMDIMMPGMDGYETCQAIKKNKAFSDVPIIFVSALSNSFDKVKAFKSGGVDYVPKPINDEELLMRIDVHLKNVAYRTDIESLNRKLDRKVKKRTLELQNSNKELIGKNIELNQLSKELKEGKESLQLVIEGAELGTFELDLIKRTIRYNIIAALTLGYPEEFIQPDLEFWLALVHPDDIHALKKVIDIEHCRNNERFDICYRIKHSCGQWLWYHVKGKVKYSTEGEPVSASAIIMDITEQKISEVALTDSEKKFRILSNFTSEGIFIHNNGTVVECNQAFVKLMEMESKTDIIGKPIPFNKVVPGDREKVMVNMKNKYVGTTEIIIERNNGDLNTLELETSDINYQGEEMRLVALRNITTQKQEQHLTQKRLNLLEMYPKVNLEQLLIIILNDLVELIACDGAILLPFKEALYYDTIQTWSSSLSDKLVNKKPISISLDLKPEINNCIKTKKPILVENLSNDGLDIYNSLLYPVVRSGQVVSIMHFINKAKGFTASDILLVDQIIDWYRETAERKRTEYELQLSEQRFENIFKNSLTPMLLIEPSTGEITNGNTAAANLYKCTSEQLNKRYFYSLNNCPRRSTIKKLQEVVSGKSNSFKFVQKINEEKTIHVEVFFSLIKGVQGDILFSIVIDQTKEFVSKNELLKVNRRLKGLDNIVHYNATSIHGLLDYAVDEVKQYTLANRAYLFMYQKTSSVFVLSNFDKEIRLTHTFKGEDNAQQVSILNRAVFQKKIIIDSGKFNDEELAVNKEDNSYYFTAAIPIIFEDQVEAVIWLGRQSRAFEYFELEQVSLLLETTWLLVEKQQLQQRMEAIS